jgi:hypothetical protein
VINIELNIGNIMEFEQSFNEHSLFKNIDIWEKESISRIQITAQTTRANLRQIIEKSKERFSKAYRDLMNNIRSFHDDDDKLNRWMEQLKQLQLEILSPLSDNTRKNLPTPITQDRFSKVIGSMILNEGGLLAKHTNEDWNYEYVLGERLYSQGRHTIQFKIEQNGTPYNIFFGCISSQAIQHRISIKSSFTIGWFGYNQVYQHGIRNDNPNLHGYNSNEFATDDLVQLTFDCERKQIELFHEDTNKKHVLEIDITKAPFPWQLLMVLTDKDDCVRIIPTDMKKIQTNLLIE